jgi:valyl-tRNA synthetase
LRSWKAENGIPLNEQITLIELIGEGAERLSGCEKDIVQTIRAKELKISRQAELEERIVALRPVLSKIGPMFKQRAKEIVGKLQELVPAEVAASIETAPVEVMLSDGSTVQVDKDLVTFEKKLTLHGKEVKTFQVKEVLVAVQR